MTSALGQLGLPWVDDLRRLPPAFLASGFRPADNGLTDAEIATALTGHPRARSYLLEHLDQAVAERIAAASPANAPDAVFAAEAKLVGVYFWMIVYYGFPDVYEQFSASQRIPYQALFPRSLISGKSVADLGAGTGAALGYLATHARRVIAIDPVAPMLDLAGAKHRDDPRVSFATGSFSAIPLPDRSVDVVVSCYAFQTSEERGGRRGIAEIRRVLARGGVAALAVGNQDTASFWRSLGLRVTVCEEPVIWVRPANPSPLLRRMFDITGIDFKGADTLRGEPMSVLWLDSGSGR